MISVKSGLRYWILSMGKFKLLVKQKRKYCFSFNQCSTSTPPENINKLPVFLMFSGGIEWNVGWKWFNVFFGVMQFDSRDAFRISSNQTPMMELLQLNSFLWGGGGGSNSFSLFFLISALHHAWYNVFKIKEPSFAISESLAVVSICLLCDYVISINFGYINLWNFLKRSTVEAGSLNAKCTGGRKTRQ